MDMGGLRRLRRKGAGGYAVGPLHASAKPQREKLSAVILDFARPLTENVDDGHFDIAITLAVLCWNVALLPEDKQEQELRLIASTMAKDKPSGFADEMMSWTRWLLDRKKKLFGHDRRMVVNYTLENKGDEFHLYVASAPVPDSPAGPQ
jgi:hypothetical protein